MRIFSRGFLRIPLAVIRCVCEGDAMSEIPTTPRSRGRKIQALRDLFLGGWSPEKTAQCLVLGTVISIFPIPGAATLLCAGAAVRLRLNLPAIQAINWMMAGLQLALIIPFIHAGGWIIQGTEFVLSRAEMQALMQQGFFAFMTVAGEWVIQAIIGWLAAAVPVSVLVYFILTMMLRFVAERRSAAARMSRTDSYPQTNSAPGNQNG